MGQRPGRRQPRHPTTYAGLTICLRCDAEFMSWDRRQNRLCARCRDAIERDPSGEPEYRMPKRRGRPPRDG
jgi:hypothetical protein